MNQEKKNPRCGCNHNEETRKNLPISSYPETGDLSRDPCYLEIHAPQEEVSTVVRIEPSAAVKITELRSKTGLSARQIISTMIHYAYERCEIVDYRRDQGEGRTCKPQQK